MLARSLHKFVNPLIFCGKSFIPMRSYITYIVGLGQFIFLTANTWFVSRHALILFMGNTHIRLKPIYIYSFILWWVTQLSITNFLNAIIEGKFYNNKKTHTHTFNMSVSASIVPYRKKKQQQNTCLSIKTICSDFGV